MSQPTDARRLPASILRGKEKKSDVNQILLLLSWPEPDHVPSLNIVPRACLLRLFFLYPLPSPHNVRLHRRVLGSSVHDIDTLLYLPYLV